MKTIGRHYITLQGCDDVNKAIQVMKNIGLQLESMGDDNLVASYFLRVLYNEETIIDEMLKPEEILLFSQDKLPVVFVNVSFEMDQEFKQPFQILEEEFELKLFKSFSF